VKCIEEEIPFEVPEGWEWSRITGLCTKITDGTHHSPENFPSGDYMYVTAKNIKETGVVLDDITFVSKNVHDEIFSRCNPERGDILYIKDGATSGIATINDIDEEFSLLSSVALLKPSHLTNNWFLCYVMQSPYFYATTRGDMKGVGITRITLTMINSRLIPVAPIDEQQRIVDCLRQALPKLQELSESNQEMLDLIDITKDKILDMAIRGELISQNPNDEPASVLLEQIRAEKENLIKQGKLKRDKKESIIYKGDDNSYYEKFSDGSIININSDIPFDIPKTWEWCRLRHIGAIVGGGTPKTAIADYWDGDVPWITPADLSGYKEMYISGGTRNISSEGLCKSSAQLLPKHTVLFSSRAPIGYVAIANTAIATNQGFKSFIPATGSIKSEYIYFCLKARISNIEMRASGTTFKEISGSEMAETLIPLPPVNEQCEITGHLKSYIKFLETIATNLS